MLKSKQKGKPAGKRSGVGSFNAKKMLLPVFIGLGVIIWLFASEFEVESFKHVRFTLRSAGYILLAFVFIFGRDFGLIWRFKTMTDHLISWKQAYYVHILAEFTSAVTPSAVGGSALVAFFLNKEGVSGAKSTTIMVANLFLDELFFVLILPILFLLVPINEVFNSTSVLSGTIGVLFWTVYAILFCWTLFLYLILFYNSSWLKPITKVLFRVPFLRRWLHKIDGFFEQLALASEEIKKKPKKFWLLAFGTTALSWISRFLVVNALFMAFIDVDNHPVIFARQVLLWVVMIVSPTPGGSGLSEYAFKEYYNDIALGVGPILVIVLIWRIISYYLYLILGATVIPQWLNKSFGKQN